MVHAAVHCYLEVVTQSDLSDHLEIDLSMVHCNNMKYFYRVESLLQQSSVSSPVIKAGLSGGL